MIYSRLTNTELERLVYTDRTNTEALAEMACRTPALVEDAEEAEKELQQSIDDYEQRIDALQTEVAADGEMLAERDNENDVLAIRLAQSEEDFDEINALLISAKVRIAALTYAEDLV